MRDHTSVEETSERLDRPEAEQYSCPDDRDADHNQLSVYGELRQNMRQSENAKGNSNELRPDQQIPATAILGNCVRIAAFARDEPYLKGDPHPITYR